MQPSMKNDATISAKVR